MNVKIMAFKGAGQMTSLHSVIAKVFPCMKIFFNSRHPKKTMISYIHTMQSPEMEAMMHYQYHDLFMPSLPFDYDSPELQELQTKLIRETRIISIPKSFAYSYGATVDFYLRHKDIYKCCILYEDLVADTESETRRLFMALDLSEDLVPYAMEAMKTHSQGNFFGDPNKDKRKKELNDKDFEEINEAFRDIKVPLDTNMSVEAFKELF